jgi:hypothetical protein
MVEQVQAILDPVMGFSNSIGRWWTFRLRLPEWRIGFGLTGTEEPTARLKPPSSSPKFHAL